MTDLNGVHVSDEDMRTIEEMDDEGFSLVELVANRKAKNDAATCEGVVLEARSWKQRQVRDAARMVVQGMDGKVGSEA